MGRRQRQRAGTRRDGGGVGRYARGVSAVVATLAAVAGIATAVSALLADDSLAPVSHIERLDAGGVLDAEQAAHSLPLAPRRCGRLRPGRHFPVAQRRGSGHVEMAVYVAQADTGTGPATPPATDTGQAPPAGTDTGSGILTIPGAGTDTTTTGGAPANPKLPIEVLKNSGASAVAPPAVDPGTPVTQDFAIRMAAGTEDLTPEQVATVSHDSKPTVSATGRPTVDGRTVDLVASFDGLDGKCAYVLWTLFHARSQRPFAHAWLVDHAGLRFSISRPHARGSGVFWVPLPRERGPYFVKAAVYDRDGSQLDIQRSGKFR